MGFLRPTPTTTYAGRIEHSSDPGAAEIATAVDALDYLIALRAVKKGMPETHNP